MTDEALASDDIAFRIGRFDVDDVIDCVVRKSVMADEVKIRCLVNVINGQRDALEVGQSTADAIVCDCHINIGINPCVIERRTAGDVGCAIAVIDVTAETGQIHNAI